MSSSSLNLYLSYEMHADSLQKQNQIKQPFKETCERKAQCLFSPPLSSLSFSASFLCGTEEVGSIVCSLESQKQSWQNTDMCQPTVKADTLGLKTWDAILGKWGLVVISDVEKHVSVWKFEDTVHKSLFQNKSVDWNLNVIKKVCCVGLLAIHTNLGGGGSFHCLEGFTPGDLQPPSCNPDYSGSQRWPLKVWEWPGPLFEELQMEDPAPQMSLMAERAIP